MSFVSVSKHLKMKNEHDPKSKTYHANCGNTLFLKWSLLKHIAYVTLDVNRSTAVINPALKIGLLQAQNTVANCAIHSQVKGK
jgi:hypothetical protein